MNTTHDIDVEQSLQGTRVDVGESVRCDNSHARLHEGHPVTVVARLRKSGRWDIEDVYSAVDAPTTLDAYERRDGEARALAEGELAVVLQHQQSWLMLATPDVLEWVPSE